MRYSYSKNLNYSFQETENEDKTTKIVFPKAESLLEVTDNKDIFVLSKKVDKLLLTAFNKIK